MYEEIPFKVGSYPSRKELRDAVLFKFMKEHPGLGTGDKTSRYRYYVETLSDGKRIYLTRPAYLKKGFDFRISVEGIIFQTGHDYPKHDDIFEDLRLKNRDNPKMAKQLHETIIRVYNCEDPDDILPQYNRIQFNVGYSIDLILKVIKWFFIEQDIRDWNYSGRKMFKDGIDEILDI